MIVWGVFAKPAKFAHAGRRRRPHRVFEQNGGLFQEAADADLRFGDDINSADFQSADGGLGSRAG